MDSEGVILDFGDFVDDGQESAVIELSIPEWWNAHVFLNGFSLGN